MLIFGQLRSFLLPMLAMFLLTACASKNEVKNKQAAIYFGAGTQNLMEKQYTDALKNLLEANRLNPDSSEILNNLGMAYYFKGDQTLAIQYLNRSLELDNKNADTRTNLASIYYKMGKIQEAESLYKKVLEDLTYDKQARTYFNLGLIELKNHQNISAAEKYFEKSIKEDENYCPSQFELGKIHYQRRQFNRALKQFKEATMGMCYNSPAPHYYQALAMIELRRFDDARLKLDEIDTRFKKSRFATMARSKANELNSIVKQQQLQESHASRKMLESPDF